MGNELHELELLIDLFGLFLYSHTDIYYLHDNVSVVALVASVTSS